MRLAVRGRLGLGLPGPRLVNAADSPRRPPSPLGGWLGGEIDRLLPSAPQRPAEGGLRARGTRRAGDGTPCGREAAFGESVAGRGQHRPRAPPSPDASAGDQRPPSEEERGAQRRMVIRVHPAPAAVAGATVEAAPPLRPGGAAPQLLAVLIVTRGRARPLLLPSSEREEVPGDCSARGRRQSGNNRVRGGAGSAARRTLLAGLVAAAAGAGRRSRWRGGHWRSRREARHSRAQIYIKINIFVSYPRTSDSPHEACDTHAPVARERRVTSTRALRSARTPARPPGSGSTGRPTPAPGGSPAWAPYVACQPGTSRRKPEQGGPFVPLPSPPPPPPPVLALLLALLPGGGASMP